MPVTRNCIGRGEDARRALKMNIVKKYGHVVRQGYAFVMIMIRHSASVLHRSRGMGREWTEKRNETVLAHLVSADFH